jgi:hypothetical protein
MAAQFERDTHYHKSQSLTELILVSKRKFSWVQSTLTKISSIPGTISAFVFV